MSAATPEVIASQPRETHETTEPRGVKPPAGEGFVWLTAMGLAVGIIMIVGLLGLIFYKGVQTFWPRDVHVVQVAAGSGFQLKGSDTWAGAISDERVKRVMDADGLESREYQFFVGNRDAYGLSFFYVDAGSILSKETPSDILQAERQSWGDAIFYPVKLTVAQGVGATREIPSSDRQFLKQLRKRIEQVTELREEMDHLNRDRIGSISRQIVEKQRKVRVWREEGADRHAERIAKVEAQIAQLQEESQHLQTEAASLREHLERDKLTYRLATGEERTIAVSELVKVWAPNAMGFFDKLGWFVGDFWAFLTEEPREANTEGGIFPTIFGTVVLVMLMSVAVMPFGVVAAIYLREYATQGAFVQMVRICINNLAGVPSIVYGVFGLGFFVYVLGGSIDAIFFPHHEAAVFKSGGIMWAALTLALMTVPVVVVATEEAFAAVPMGLREASLACGASKWQTIQHIVLPAAAPGILTGLILAIARGAGEVAPLMLVGVIKLAPSLPIDGEAPFVHLERKFMHLGFHIFDLGFQSPDSEAAKPMVFATTFLLILLVVALNLGAILIREHLRKKYAYGNF